MIIFIVFKFVFENFEDMNNATGTSLWYMHFLPFQNTWDHIRFFVGLMLLNP